MRKTAFGKCSSMLTRDVEDRKKQLSEFSIEVEKHTLRKIDMLQHELAAHHMNQKHDDTKQQQSINSLCDDLDTLHEALYEVSQVMIQVSDTICADPETSGSSDK